MGCSAELQQKEIDLSTSIHPFLPELKRPCDEVPHGLLPRAFQHDRLDAGTVAQK